MFKKHVEEVFCTVRGDVDEQFARMQGDFSLLDIDVNVSKQNKITCHWFQNPIDTGLILNFCSCAPLQHRKYLIQRTFQEVYNALSDWLAFDRWLEKNKK